MTRTGPLAAAVFVCIVAASCGRVERVAPQDEGLGRRPGQAGPEVQADAWRAVTDMRGVEVRVPRHLARVATVNDGFVESVMTRFGVIRTLVAVSSASLQDTWSYSYPASSGGTWTIDGGMGTMRALHPWIAGLPNAGSSASDAVNVETLAAAKPDVVIIRAGDCTLGLDAEGTNRVAALIESLGIPVVVLRSPAVYQHAGLDPLREELLTLGRVFEHETDAAALADELADAEAMIRQRVPAVSDAARPTVLYLGLAAGARSSGGAAYVWGTDTTESWMLEQVAGGRNAYRGAGARVLLNAEQMLALDPDVILLPTSAGYHPPRELADAPYFSTLRRLKAVRHNRVYSMPWTPNNCARRLEYPVDLMVMAKALHPEAFRDVAVHRWVLDFYGRLYGLDADRATLLRRSQWLAWMVETGF